MTIVYSVKDNNCSVKDNNCSVKDNNCSVKDNNCSVKDNKCSVKDNKCSVDNMPASLSLSPDSLPHPHRRKLLWHCPPMSPWRVWSMPTSSFEGHTSAVGVEPRPTASAWSATASCARSAVGSTPRSPPRRPPRPLPKGSSLCQTWQGQLLVGLGSGLTAKWPPFCDGTQACTHTHTLSLSLLLTH